jgi:hypothetical protein
MRQQMDMVSVTYVGTWQVGLFQSRRSRKVLLLVAATTPVIMQRRKMIDQRVQKCSPIGKNCECQVESLKHTNRFQAICMSEIVTVALRNQHKRGIAKTSSHLEPICNTGHE